MGTARGLRRRRKGTASPGGRRCREDNGKAILAERQSRAVLREGCGFQWLVRGEGLRLGSSKVNLGGAF